MQISQPSCLARSRGFHWSRADAYLFDIDGTLINTRDATHYDAFHNAVRAVFKVEPRIDGVPLHGNTDVAILRAVLRRAGLSDAEFEAKLPAALEHMCAEVARKSAHIHPELCPSVHELLERLQSEGKLLGVVSGNLERIGWLKLQAAKLRRFFAFGCFSDHHELREDIFRSGINEARSRLCRDAAVCVVGDTPADILAAHKSGIPVIAVATGIFKPADLLAHQPDACFTCCTELLAQSE
jgi:phosphoglycolate phosphatase-like HAD superfamily hydrolase